MNNNVALGCAKDKATQKTKHKTRGMTPPQEKYCVENLSCGPNNFSLVSECS